MPPDGAFHRAPRPLIGWGGVVLIVGCLAFLVLLAIPVLRALNRWADGEHVDLAGFAAVLAAAIPALSAVWRFVERYMTTRHVERMDQQARGTAPNVPFDPAPSPESWPRSGDSP